MEVPDEQTAQSLAFVISFFGLQRDVRLVLGSSALRLQLADAVVLTGHNTICRYLASKTAQAEALLGRSHEAQAQVRIVTGV